MADLLDFETIYLSHRPRLLKYFSLCFDPETAEDLCQQLFLKQWIYMLRRPGFEPENWQAWLFRAAVNLKNNHIRMVRLLPVPFGLKENQDSPVMDGEDICNGIQ